MTTAAATRSGPVPLPSLRPDLTLMRGTPGLEGEERWLIHDPLQQRYVQIELVTYRLLQLWPQCETAAALSEAMLAVHQIEVGQDDIATFAQFLGENLFTTELKPDGWRALHAKGVAKRSMFSRALHNYLFFRIPLVRPDAFLRATLPAVSLLFTRTAVGIVGLLGVIGLYLVSRQWESFLNTFQHFFSMEGMLAFAAALVLVKVAHEFGHAYAAVRYGCHVPTMGIAFILLTPLPYTDVTDAWKLTERRQRLLIDSAGMLVEFGVALIATFLWAFLPDGPLRSVCFMLGTVGWLMSLAVNLNPFMRFDGYYILSELTGVENLQARAFALGRWRLREILFAVGTPSPEQLRPWKANALTAYAWAVWAYRLILFIGIALFVYHYFFKLLGIGLFLVEIIFFVVRPVFNELKVWWSMRDKLLRQPRTWATMSGAAALVALAVVPWSQAVYVPAMLELAHTTQIYPPVPAVVEAVEIRQGQKVKAGDVLIRMTSPDLDRQIEMAETQMKLTRVRLARRTGDEVDREQTLVLQNEETSLTSRIAGLQQERQRLVVRAPMTGRVLELSPGLHRGRWVSPKDMIGLIGDDTETSARGYLAEDDLWRIAAGTPGTFIPEMPSRPAAEVAVTDVSLGGVASVDLKELSSIYGGHVAVSANREGRHLPTTAQYLVRFAVEHVAQGPDRIVRGTVILRGEPESFLSRAWRRILAVGIRESGI